MAYWLLKTEPNTFCLQDLQNCPQQSDAWTGVRNYQARNFICQMKRGDNALFYHSNCANPAIVGIVTIISEPYPDGEQFVIGGNYFDSRATLENPRWYCVDVKFKEQFKKIISLKNIRNISQLANMYLLRRGNRLSVMPIDERHWQIIIALAQGINYE